LGCSGTFSKLSARDCLDPSYQDSTPDSLPGFFFLSPLPKHKVPVRFFFTLLPHLIFVKIYHHQIQQLREELFAELSVEFSSTIDTFVMKSRAFSTLSSKL
jgi:hypothetical protein